MAEKKRILVAPLDWGLGHASRCIPIIREIIALGHEAVIAADGRAYDLLQKEFPGLETIRLRGYLPFYPADGNMVFAMARQVPKFLAAIIREHYQLKKIIHARSIDAIISDNRYGLWSRKTVCVFITHQLRIKMPVGMKWMEGPVNSLNHFFVRRFHHCWIPDSEGIENLSGELSHGNNLPGNTKYIGIANRFQPNSRNGTVFSRDLLVLLSGPEPQRTLLEEELKKQLMPLEYRTLIVRGVTEESKREKPNENIEIVSHLAAGELEDAMRQSGMVICRSGYSTIMELAALRKKALLVPTPGQTEQEYLAERCARLNYFSTQRQHQLNLKEGIATLQKSEPHSIRIAGSKVKSAIMSLVEN